MTDMSAHLPGLAAAKKAEEATSLQRTIGKIVAIGAVVCILVVVGWVMLGRANNGNGSSGSGTDAPIPTNLEAARPC